MSVIDDIPTLEERLTERASRVQSIQNQGIKIVHICCCCRKRIDTYWDKWNELDGRWMALETNFSEILYSFVAYPDKVLCNYCFGTGEWKKKGIKIK